jgi:two-component system phosphate regulon response regulator PhoB
MAESILVVDDEPDILELVRFNLTRAGYQVLTAATGSEALTLLRTSRPDLVLLDLMLPDSSGTEICREIRNDPALKSLPVIMLTAKGEEVDRIVGFELGTDDYVTKPFSPRELVLRVKALLRRGTAEATAEGPLCHGPLVLDPERHRCQVNDESIDLTAKEFALLETLMTRPGRVLSREQLLEKVWGSDVQVTLRTIDTHLKRLREKLGPAGTLIDTIRGVGYRFTD